MLEPLNAQRKVTYVVVVGLMGLVLCLSKADAKSSSVSSSTTAKAAVCDYHARPVITTVTPRHVKPGQRITISGKNFGTKNCFHSVSFGPKSSDTFTYVSPTTIEATVPTLRPGSIPVTVSTEAGTSEFKLEVQVK